MSQEIDYLLGVDINGVKVSDESESIPMRVAEWLDTPQGQIWGAPHWGNRLMPYKHEPINSDTAAAMENSIVMSLPVDVKGAVITEILIEPKDFDMYHIVIGLLGAQNYIQKEVKL
ncbi:MULTISPECIES: hypothetical protein [unclassified Vibrio]|uniref:hypothetical protein n=1 Tax=unclassified Vibrio TaxID=2614977 RepID=UPI001268F99F|nr:MULTISPECIES: hypothetical protein [unclassified Vibrio]QFT40120.1 hypothetical protein FIU99_27390 [Vibrio sp. THAF64]QGM37943.1 hypothetical protein GGC04_26985 [Vibrio sp. THAF191d]QGN73476.1 hypothetical protein GGC03_27185 [Vibrio sp. THAF191c]